MRPSSFRLIRGRLLDGRPSFHDNGNSDADVVGGGDDSGHNDKAEARKSWTARPSKVGMESKSRASLKSGKFIRCPE